MRSTGYVSPPEIWMPTISPAEDAPLPPPARRGSAASMRSTGYGANIRPSVTKTIPEQADDDDDDDDDGPDESDIEENDYELIEHVTPRISTTTDKSSRDEEKRPHLRRNSHQSSVDTGNSLHSDSDLGLRPDDRLHRPIDSPGKPPCQNLRPTPARSSYGGDDRDHSYQYTTSHRHHGFKPTPYLPQRESRPISRQASFTRQPFYLDLDDENDERERLVREGRDRERLWVRDRDRDGDADGGRDIHSAATDPRPLTTMIYPYSARPGPGLSRQSSNIRPPRGDPDRRFSGGDNGS